MQIETHLEAILRLRFAKTVSLEAVKLIDVALERDVLYHEHLRLLPMLYERLPELGFSQSSETKIKSLYRHTHYRNRILIDRAIKAQKILQDAFSLPVLFLKGLGLSLTVYQHMGERPMSDIDIFMPGLPLDFGQSALFLALFPGARVKRDVPCALTFVDAQGFEYDLHRRLHILAGDPSVDALLLRDHPLISFEADRIPVPCLAHQLMHILFHGLFSAGDAFSKRWMADALTLLQRGDLDIASAIALSEQVACPGLIREGLRQLLALPEDISFDRNSVKTLLTRLPTNQLWLQKMCLRNPTPSHIKVKQKRWFWIKEGFIFLILVPLFMLRKQSALNYYRNLFGSHSLMRCFQSFTRRSIQQVWLLLSGEQPSKS